MQKAMQKVLNARNFIYLFTCILIMSCHTSKNTINNKIPSSSYEIKKFKSFGNWITINAFDKGAPYGKIPPLIIINNLYFTKTNSFNVGQGKHTIEIDFIGKISANIEELIVKENDSIVINAYLKDDPTPIVD